MSTWMRFGGGGVVTSSISRVLMVWVRDLEKLNLFLDTKSRKHQMNKHNVLKWMKGEDDLHGHASLDGKIIKWKMKMLAPLTFFEGGFLILLFFHCLHFQKLNFKDNSVKIGLISVNVYHIMTGTLCSSFSSKIPDDSTFVWADTVSEKENTKIGLKWQPFEVLGSCLTYRDTAEPLYRSLLWCY